jgi:tetratricopeptide (TPR) repeat protein
MIGASSFLVTGQPQRALDFYRAALGTGERSEIDLNLGRAYAGLNRRDAADAALLRAGWISPEILASLPQPSRDALLVKIADLDADLRAGRLAAPPPLPSD